ncbi:elongin-C-like [Aphis craccivora]|uniref:Elongin-C n=1 Tax=Aphis craccivora TaxID=307492 RepID=A0A6G0YN53_APHCR|nr:elongin-C-like [Aphis craccivora]
MDGASGSSGGYGPALDGPNSAFIRLVSSDDREFIVKREHALMSNTIKTMMQECEGFLENQTNRIHFALISGNILEIVCKYFMHKAHYQKCLELVPEFPISPDDALQLMKASSFLDC